MAHLLHTSILITQLNLNCHIFQLELEKREEEVWCYYQHEWDQLAREPKWKMRGTLNAVNHAVIR